MDNTPWLCIMYNTTISGSFEPATPTTAPISSPWLRLRSLSIQRWWYFTSSLVRYIRNPTLRPMYASDDTPCLCISNIPTIRSCQPAIPTTAPMPSPWLRLRSSSIQRWWYFTSSLVRYSRGPISHPMYGMVNTPCLCITYNLTFSSCKPYTPTTAPMPSPWLRLHSSFIQMWWYFTSSLVKYSRGPTLRPM